MAKLTTSEQAGIQSAIDLLVKGSAYETPISLDVLERISPVIDSLGVSYQGKSNYDFAKDNPVTALIGLVWVCGALAGTLTDAQATVMLDAVTYMTTSTAYETPFAEDVILRIAPVAESTGFLTRGGFCEAVRDTPVSTMLKWALQLGG
jgi:hypothetical protein